jgi:hypothetical protein
VIARTTKHGWRTKHDNAQYDHKNTRPWLAGGASLGGVTAPALAQNAAALTCDQLNELQMWESRKGY